jgi:hypothetical protein
MALLLELVRFILRLNSPGRRTRTLAVLIEPLTGPCGAGEIACSDALLVRCGDTLPAIAERRK